MAKSTLLKSSPAANEKPLFFLRIPTDRPTYDPNPRSHLGLAADHLKNQIGNLETVENLAAIDEENDTIHAMAYGITAVLENLREIHQHFRETIELIEPATKDGD